MRRLPNVNEVVAQVLKQADDIRQQETEKTAESLLPSFTIPVAEGMYKLATVLRSIDPEKVTLEDVNSFANRLMEQA